MLDNLNARVLLIIETTIETVAEHEYIDTLSFEVLTVVQFQILRMTYCNSCQQYY